MEMRERLAKKRQEAEALRDESPATTLIAGSDLCMFAIQLQSAADRANPA